MSDKDGMIAIAIAVACLVGGALYGVIKSNNLWEKDAIERGYAQYNPITAEFEWKE